MEVKTGQSQKKYCKKACQDHLGNHFSSIKEMCEYYGVNVHTFYSRTLYGASIEEALTKPTKKMKESQEA